MRWHVSVPVVMAWVPCIGWLWVGGWVSGWVVSKIVFEALQA
jgi:hypothetical protein